MGKYGSINEFRAALNGIVGHAGGARSNPRPVSRTPRARRNSPVRMLPGGGFEADTAEEMAALMQTMGPGRGGFGSTPRKAAAVRKPRAARKEKAAYSGELQDPGGPVSYSQAKFIGMSIGGMAAYCPQYVHEKVSHQQALIEMGLTKGAASAVIDVMKSRGVYMQRDPGSQAAARQILEEVGRVSCPVPKASLGQRRALNNPRRRR
jgi:hypothetical protein